MPDREDLESLLLPPRTRLLHIGPMKTGTTSLQLAARGRRDILLAHGVRYPGTEVNQRRQLGALMGWSVNTWNRSKPLQPDRLDVDTTGVPPRKDWDDLKAEIEADQERRIFITHEFVSQVDDATARRIVEAIGEPIHICLTLRAPGQIVPSLWAQSVRDDAQTEPYDHWLDRFFGKDPDHPISERFQRAYDQGRLVERWAGLVGPDNVTVIIVDKSDPGLLTGAFESMLGLPPGTLDWRRSNSSLAAIDAELFRHVNAVLRDKGASWSTFHNLVRYGAIKYGPERRKVSPDEPRTLLPAWAAEIADRDGARFAESIRESKVRVVGNLDNLTAASPSGDWHSIDEIPVGIAAEAVAGAIVAGQKARSVIRKELDARTAELTKIKKDLARVTAERDVIAADLAAARSRTLDRRVRAIARSRSAQVLSTFRSEAAGAKRRLVRKLRAHGSEPR